MAVLIAPSILSANFLNLAKDIEMINESQADLIHIDVMDGHFVPNLTFGFLIIEQIKSIAKKPLDVHLMINNPERHIKAFKDAGADWLSVHFETCPHLHNTIESIKNLDLVAGVVINPHTPVSLLRDILPFSDFVLVMSVNPGFGGQNFIANTYQRLNELRTLKDEVNNRLLIEVDGGVNLENSSKLVEAGANILVAGSAVFKAHDPALFIKKMKQNSTMNDL
ncbi:MAG TPA: ribulose-phosphate 3-epimerase [Bacteroidales bacterium]|nr:ribulose-phosphate 3-epimerase [Bacteroidales bacterium]